MKKLPEPPYDFNHVLTKCADGMKHVHMKAIFLSSKAYLIPMESQYRQLGKSGKLFKFQKTGNLNENIFIVPGLNKSNLRSLYFGNLRNPKKPARLIYDKLLASSNGRCPFCGDIGDPKNIDHFLPIAHYPQLSVLPLNLVPSCRDCNMGSKGDDYAIEARDQILNPYLDDDCFYSQQWVFASYINHRVDDPINPGAIVYTAAPPIKWNLVDAQRAIKHFSTFDLARRYSSKAGDHLSDVVSQRNDFYEKNKNLMPAAKLEEEFIDTFLKPIITGPLFENHWRKIMYKCLSQSRAFLQGTTVDVFSVSEHY